MPVSRPRSRRRILNLYGPSEDTTYTTYVRVPRVREGEPTIGRPVAGTRIFLFDRSLRPAAQGVVGELCIAGSGLARGYLNSPRLTAEKWIPDPFGEKPGGRLYRSGDLARRLQDGQLEFLGRRDHQVKLRGFRIELGEIESALAGHPGVKAAAVLAWGEGAEKRLAAYLAPEKGASLPASELRAGLAKKMPQHMVPTDFIILESLPLLPNGKIDRKALPPPGSRRGLEGAYLPPRDSLELELAGLWEEVLGTGRVGIRDNFFERGGHSLLAVRLMGRILHSSGRELPLSTLFERPTVEGLADLLRSRPQQARRSPLRAIRRQGTRRPFFCVHPVGGNVLCYRELAQRLAAEQPFFAFEAPGLEPGSRPLARVEKMAALYNQALQEVQPQGPCLLGGWSSGGVIAFEMAQQLVRRGRPVALLAVIDSFVPNDVPHLDERQILMLHAWQFGFPHSLLQGLDADEMIGLLAEKMSDRQSLPTREAEAQIRRLLSVYRSNLAAVRSYQAKPYPGRLTFFRAACPDEYGDYSKHFGKSPKDPLPAWQRLTEGPLEVFEVAAAHNTLMLAPQAGELARLLDACLAQAQQTDAPAGEGKRQEREKWASIR